MKADFHVNLTKRPFDAVENSHFIKNSISSKKPRSLEPNEEFVAALGSKNENSSQEKGPLSSLPDQPKSRENLLSSLSSSKGSKIDTNTIRISESTGSQSNEKDVPKIYEVICPEGEEYALVIKITRRYFASGALDEPLQILSILTKSAGSGRLYIEAYETRTLCKAICGFPGVYTNLKLVTNPMETSIESSKLSSTTIIEDGLSYISSSEDEEEDVPSSKSSPQQHIPQKETPNSASSDCSSCASTSNNSDDSIDKTSASSPRSNPMPLLHFDLVQLFHAGSELFGVIIKIEKENADILTANGE
uniref:NGN domain-containing protein n=1 Tax=Acrobeloides nanus TaxID=290746 RepID=A0A914CMN4_9BILA